MNASQLATAILSANLSVEDVRHLNDVIRQAFDMAQKRVQMQFRKGQRVKFTNSKTGETIYGTITKLAQKNIQLTQEGGSRPGCRWTVGPSHISAA